MCVITAFVGLDRDRDGVWPTVLMEQPVLGRMEARSRAISGSPTR